MPPAGRPARMVGAITDITERKRAEEAIAQSVASLRATLESTADGILTIGPDRRIESYNRPFVEMWRIPADVLGLGDDDVAQRFVLDQLVAPEVFRQKVRYLYDHPLEESFDQLEFKDGRVIERFSRPMVVEGRPTGRVWSFRDITERRRAEHEREKLQTRLFQNQKFEALGTLAGGVAHDFNNILTGVMNFTALAREECPASLPVIRDYLGEVLKGGNRAKELVRQILLLSRSEDGARAPLQAALIVREALSLLRSTIPISVEIRAEVDRRAPLILANATQIHQVVMNLGINAAHAMRAGDGVLTVKLAPRQVDAALAAELPELKPGPYVCLEIADTGSGMEPAVVARIFEPFFTTKKVGEGTGLGLAVVRSVVRSHQGAVQVRTRPGAGSTFELFFPVCAAPASGDAAVNRRFPRGRGQRILLVDDEAMVVRSMQLVLERLGYVVTACPHPERARAEFENAPGHFDLLLTDFQMPGMTGVELSRWVLARRADLPVLLASGFAGDLTEEKIRELGLRGLVRKPVDMGELAELLARIFGTPESSPGAGAAG